MALVTHIVAAEHSTNPGARPPGPGGSTWTVELLTDLDALRDDPDAQWLATHHPRRVWGTRPNPDGLTIYDGRTQADVERAECGAGAEGAIRAYALDAAPAACALLMPVAVAGVTGEQYWRTLAVYLRSRGVEAVRLGPHREIRFLNV